MSTSSWTTMGPTRRPSSGGGLRSVHASMSTTRPPTGPGSTWSSGGLPNSPTSKSAAGFTAVSANWRPPSANSSPPTTKPPSLSFGPKPPTKSSPASLATRNALSPPNPGNLSHEPLGQETSHTCGASAPNAPTPYPLPERIEHGYAPELQLPPRECDPTRARRGETQCLSDPRSVAA